MNGAILVTGAAGLVGAAVASALRNAGARVLGVDLNADPDKGTVACDLLDADKLQAVAAPWTLGAIVHCGAVSGPSLYRDDPGYVARTNVESTLNLLELARARGIPRFVFASSASVYGRTPPGEEVREERPLRPTSVYAATKVAGEALVEAYSRQCGISGVSLRIAAVYGPGRRTPCSIRNMILAGFEGKALELPFGRDQRYHYIHVEDVAAAILAAVRARSFPRSAYTIAADRGITLGRLAELLREIVPGPPVVVAASDDPLSDPQGPYALGAAREDLGWQAAVDLSAGIRSYAGFLASEKLKSPLQINSIA
ncbi:NAD(P)-dependent oxidoreductase [Chelativorans sp.]|uniref:NAD-dependent epimerase/dehydratase family protein n=1 Tax=Chelativorans sp. TaxID=2203393 RepID=UPI002811682E|nr:NAD(P)-dependent oxidoreductase [Chelativorans sp.]